mmetsp:Transcript_15761/g.40177  ORF Transcript_15761/g.40177 Transcript_15761/m.40177 type:complete len:210 (+) Transcript_15761:600-1229(+)
MASYRAPSARPPPTTKRARPPATKRARPRRRGSTCPSSCSMRCRVRAKWQCAPTCSTRASTCARSRCSPCSSTISIGVTCARTFCRVCSAPTFWGKLCTSMRWVLTRSWARPQRRSPRGCMTGARTGSSRPTCWRAGPFLSCPTPTSSLRWTWSAGSPAHPSSRLGSARQTGSRAGTSMRSRMSPSLARQRSACASCSAAAPLSAWTRV